MISKKIYDAVILTSWYHQYHEDMYLQGQSTLISITEAMFCWSINPINPITFTTLSPKTVAIDNFSDRSIVTMYKLKRYCDIYSFRAVATCVCLCVCPLVSSAINYIHMILTLYNKLNKFATFWKVTNELGVALVM